MSIRCVWWSAIQGSTKLDLSTMTVSSPLADGKTGASASEARAITVGDTDHRTSRRQLMKLTQPPAITCLSHKNIAISSFNLLRRLFPVESQVPKSPVFNHPTQGNDMKILIIGSADRMRCRCADGRDALLRASGHGRRMVPSCDGGGMALERGASRDVV